VPFRVTFGVTFYGPWLVDEVLGVMCLQCLMSAPMPRSTASRDSIFASPAV
jgi:hypothetical protein